MSEAPLTLETTGATTGLRFKLEKLIGRGSFGLVYKAVQLGLNRPVALKLLHPDALANMEQVGRFLNEARVTASLSHPHIVEVIDHGVAGEQPWIAYELLTGPTLRTLIPPGGMEWTRGVNIAIQLAGALDLAHRENIIHRDVKPENVIEAQPGHFKLTDFGLAKWNHRAAFRTGGASAMGTPAYIAPELIATGKAGPATDLYALAVLLYELLTGAVPFEGETTAVMLERHLKSTAVAPSVLKAGVPKEVDQAVLQALAKAPKDRQTVAAFRDALSACLDASVTFTPEQPVPARRPDPAGSSGRAIPASVVDMAASARNVAHVALNSSTVRKMALWVFVAGALVVGGVASFRSRTRPVAVPVQAMTASVAALRPASRLSAAEPAEIREQLQAVLVRQDERAERTKSLAAALNPLFLRLNDAAEHANALEAAIRADQRMLTMLRERLLAYYPEPTQVPDGELVLVARVLVNSARGWCWLENMAATRAAVDESLAAHGDQTNDSKMLDEMESRLFSAGGESFVLEAAQATREAVWRMGADPSLITPEIGELMVELYWLASGSNFRGWPPEAQVRLREVSRALARAGDGPLARAVLAIWQLGSVKATHLKPARAAAHQALETFGSSGLPHARAIADRVERELATGKVASPSPRAP